MAEQLTFTTLGGAVVTTKKRGKHYVQPRGYADHPGTGPKGETCGSCKHKTYKGGVAGHYPKCLLTEQAWSGGRKTDILVRAPACSKWEAA